jgi:hypothetical protein
MCSDLVGVAESGGAEVVNVDVARPAELLVPNDSLTSGPLRAHRMPTHTNQRRRHVAPYVKGHVAVIFRRGV